MDLRSRIQLAVDEDLGPGDLTTEATQSIRIDSRMQFEALQAFGRTYMPAVVDKLEHYRGERPLFDHFGIEEDVAK
jgi:ribonuclease G